MKKALFFFGGLIILLLLSAYVFIPDTIRFSNIVSVECTPNGISTVLHHYEKWKFWWPRSDGAFMSDSSFNYKNYHYKLITPLTDGANIELYKKEDRFTTRVLVVSLGRDSVSLEWSAGLITSLNPFKRIAQYFEANDIKNNMDDVLRSLGAFAGKTENVYGFTIQRTTFTDTILVATRFSTETYPGNEIIYNAISRLKKKIRDTGAEEKDFPMLNIKKTDDSGRYETMIAICINKEIKAAPDAFISLMVPMKDRFLETEVTGGPFTLKKAHKAIGNYMNDHLLTAPAIPFEILVTDRSKESDTAKWRTRIVYPSM